MRARVCACSIADMNTSTDTKKKYKRVIINNGGDLVTLVPSGDMQYMTGAEGSFRLAKTKFHASDVVSVSIDTVGSYSERTTGGRVAGGAVLGGVLLGPLGAAMGAGVGILAKKGRPAPEYLVLTLRDGRVLSMEVPAKHAAKGRAMVAAFSA